MPQYCPQDQGGVLPVLHVLIDARALILDIGVCFAYIQAACSCSDIMATAAGFSQD